MKMTLKDLSIRRFLLMALLLVASAIAAWEVNPSWVILTIFCTSILIDVRAAVDRLVLLTAVVLGIVPLFGWYAVPIWLNPIRVLVTLYVFDSLRTIKVPQRDMLTSLIAIAPGFSVGIFTYQWWSGLSKGTPVEVLERMLPIWDLSAHFNFFYSNLVTRVFIPRASAANFTTDWFGREYPSGIHYVLGLFVGDSRSRLIDNPQDAIPIFANSIVILFAFSVFICAIAGWRLANNNSLRFVFAVLGAGLSTALISIGPVSQTISTGFANMPAVIIPLVIIVSIHCRPLNSESAQLVTFSACIGAIAYNWYPALLLIFPMVVIQILDIADTRKKLKRCSFIFGAILLAGPPIQQTFSLGISHLDMNGGIQPFPPGRLTFILLISFSVALLSLMKSIDGFKYFWANIVPFPFAISFAVFLQARSQGYNYYFQKLMLFVAVFAAFTALFTIFQFLTELNDRLKLNAITRPLLLACTSCVVALGLSQTLGYWGLGYPEFAGSSTAYGVLNRNEITKREKRHLENSRQILRLVEITKDFAMRKKECILLFVPLESDDVSAITYGPSISLLTNVWFHSLSKSHTEKAQIISSVVTNFSSYSDATEIVTSITRTYNPDSVCIYSSKEIIQKLQESSNSWTLSIL